MKPSDGKVEPVVLLLFIGMLFFTGVLLYCNHTFPMDGQIFQVIASLLTGFSGAFFMRIKPRGSQPSDGATAAPTSTTTEDKP